MPTPCAFCGHPDAQHRLRDAILDRFLVGETRQSLALDYGASVREIDAWMQQACLERYGAAS